MFGYLAVGEQPVKSVRGALSAKGRRLVETHLGLVAFCVKEYLRRTGGSGVSPSEWADMFQEGCLGLIAAARAHGKTDSNRFAEAACASILLVLRRQRRKALCELGVRGRRRRGIDDPRHRPDVPQRVVSLSKPLERTLVDPKSLRPAGREEPPGRETGPTIGDRFSEKLRRAAHRAAEAVAARKPRRARGMAVVRRLLEERLLIPEEHQRETLRGIARRQRRPLSLVRRRDRTLLLILRRMLAADPEFGRLRELLRQSDLGRDEPMTADLDRQLAEQSCEAFLARLRTASTEQQGKLLAEWLAYFPAGWEDVFRQAWCTLDSTRREELLHMAGGRETDEVPAGGVGSELGDAENTADCRTLGDNRGMHETGGPQRTVDEF